ncbi:hypothetical protein AB0J63_30675 [Streptosporangium canum]|uniref:hypothetical protein n=1 Tax=Streptosporangium canum TaxID=324952 RepID=UPI0034254620
MISASSYIRRLARANHLKPGYLHGFLAGPPTWFGKPRLERLAVLSGRTPRALRRALADAGPAPERHKPDPSSTPKRIDEAELYRRIRHDAETENLSMRALVRRRHVTWRTVRLYVRNQTTR